MDEVAGRRPRDTGDPRDPRDPQDAGRDAARTTGQDAGADAVRAALGRARATARARGLLPERGGAARAGGTRRVAAGRRRWTPAAGGFSGSHPDARDPQTASRSIDRLVGELGWAAPVAVGGVVGRWEQVVGPEVAAHAEPETFEDGVLTVRASSTAWATQLRLLQPTIQRRLDEEVGPGVVTTLRVRGPGAPSWRRGQRRAAGGRGPRDTYG